MPEIIEFLISPDGQEIRIEPKGYAGPACEVATRGFESDLGIAKGRKRKPEYQQRGVELKVGGGR